MHGFEVMKEGQPFFCFAPTLLLHQIRHCSQSTVLLHLIHNQEPNNLDIQAKNPQYKHKCMIPSITSLMSNKNQYRIILEANKTDMS